MNSIIAAVLAISLVTLQGPGIREAENEARRDIAAGHLILRTYGLAGHTAHSRLLQERFGIRVRVVAGCVVNSRIVGETAAYNAVMKREIEKRFGRGVLEDLSASGRATPGRN